MSASWIFLLIKSENLGNSQYITMSRKPVPIFNASSIDTKKASVPVQAVKNIFNGAAPREDLHILPEEIGWVWETQQMVLSRDGSSAASNGAKNTWENSDVIDHVCAWHGSNRWFQQHLSLVKKKRT